MKMYKELRIVLDDKTHGAFKAAVSINNKSMKLVLLELIDQYIKKGK